MLKSQGETVLSQVAPTANYNKSEKWPKSKFDLYGRLGGKSNVRFLTVDYKNNLRIRRTQAM